MRTEEEVMKDLRKLYAERAKIRKENWSEYVGKCFLVNARYFYVDRILDKGFSILVVDDESVGIIEMETSPDQWKDYVIDKKVFLQALQSRVDLFIKQVKEK